nr:MAG TPA: hypothetical protein [Caudoviricetes sp.]
MKCKFQTCIGVRKDAAPVLGETDSYLRLIQICGNALATGE